MGALTHVVWDAFTHSGRWGVQLFPGLAETVHVGGVSIRGFKLLQYGSSVVFLPMMAVLLVMVLRRWPAMPVNGLCAIPRLGKIAIVSFVLGVPLIVAALRIASMDLGLHGILFRLVTMAGGCFLVSVVGYAAAFHAVTRGRYV